ncbi:MAG: hypothetical protein PHF31_07700 [Methylobacter sp.]|nr:hypothetical protein [Methylobacter sp.]
MKIEISDGIYSEIEYLHELIKNGNSGDLSIESPTELINYILSVVADGSRKPGSWERGLLDSMGIVADCSEHHVYRQTYGKPKDDGQE